LTIAPICIQILKLKTLSILDTLSDVADADVRISQNGKFSKYLAT